MRHLPLSLLLLSLVLLMVACGRDTDDEEVRASVSAPCYIGELTIASGALWGANDGVLVGTASVVVGSDGLLELRVQARGCTGCEVAVGEWGGPSRPMGGAGPWDMGSEWKPAHVMLVRDGEVLAVAYLPGGGPSI